MTLDTLWFGRAYEFVRIPEVWATAGGKYVLAGFVFSTANQWWPHPHTKSNSSRSLLQYNWSHFVDPMEVRLGEIPLLYVNITYWKLWNVILTNNSLYEDGGTYTCPSPKSMVYISSSTIIDHNRFQVCLHVTDKKRHYVCIRLSHTCRSRIPTTEYARYTQRQYS